MNLQVMHYITLVCGALGMGLPQLESQFPPSATPWIKAAAAVFVLVGTVTGVFSPNALAKKTS